MLPPRVNDPALRAKGVDDAGLRRLLVENRARALAFA
jgi:predicted metal-dependent phosphotriesterase family hydrolase